MIREHTTDKCPTNAEMIREHTTDKMSYKC